MSAAQRSSSLGRVASVTSSGPRHCCHPQHLKLTRPRPVLFRNHWEGGCGWPGASVYPFRTPCLDTVEDLWPVGSCPMVSGGDWTVSHSSAQRESKAIWKEHPVKALATDETRVKGVEGKDRDGGRRGHDTLAGTQEAMERLVAHTHLKPGKQILERGGESEKFPLLA